MLYLLVSFATIFSLVYLYLNFAWSYWKIRNVYAPTARFPFGNATDLLMQKIGFGDIMEKFYREFKNKNLRLGGIYIMHMPNLVVVDLDLIKAIMNKDFNYFSDRSVYVNEENDPLTGHLFSLRGQKWKNLRVKLTPSFTSGKIKAMFPILVKCSEGLNTLSDKCVETGEPIDVKDMFARYATDVIGSTAFGINCDSLNNPNTPFRKYGAKIIELSFYGAIKNFISFTAPEILKFLNVNLWSKDVNDFFINVVHETVKHRKQNGENRNDFMQLLIQMKKSKNYLDDGKSLTMNEIAAQAFVFFAAGFETSSSTLTFCSYELAKNLELQQKLRQEIHEVLSKHDFELTYDSLNDMTYMEKCIYETLRLYPSVPSLNRRCTQTYKVPDTDITIEKDMTIHIPIMGIHRDPEIYPDPLKFDPERFSPENKDQRHQFSWLPFGEGPRVCIGLRFGIIQVKVALVKLFRNYRVTLSDKTAVPLVLNPSMFFLNAKGNVWLNVEKIY